MCLVDSKGAEIFSIDFGLAGALKIEANDKHIDWVSKIVYLGNNRIATASGDKTIKVWEIVQPGS